MLELYLDSYTFDEDTEDYMSLAPLFVSDLDAGHGPNWQDMRLAGPFLPWVDSGRSAEVSI